MEFMSLPQFLDQGRISPEDWEKSRCDWGSLKFIAEDYERRKSAYIGAAEQISSRLRMFENVHSVRWRIKDTLGLLKKIVRKKAAEEPKPKWLDLSVDNYFNVFTDLVGVRALHLFKEDCVSIDESIRSVWNMAEDVLVYTRRGDEVFPEIINRGATEEIHKDGYRSIHYIIETSPEKEKILAELQVRTIFQEGWSEIDHKVKYPDYSDNNEVKVFLDLFNGLAGSADDMGSFVRTLTSVLGVAESEKNKAFEEKAKAVAERDQALKDIAAHIEELEALKVEDSKSKAIINKMRKNMSIVDGSQKALAQMQKIILDDQGKNPTARFYSSPVVNNILKPHSIAGAVLSSKVNELLKQYGLNSASSEEGK